eukprot:5831469-Prymnesium_polylepis.1
MSSPTNAPPWYASRLSLSVPINLRNLSSRPPGSVAPSCATFAFSLSICFSSCATFAAASFCPARCA